jgi:site-specific recombinase XerD
MSLLAPTLQAFFTDRLAKQRCASPRTIIAYRDTFRLLLGFLQQRTAKQPSELDFEDLDAPSILAFLEHLEHDRGNSARTRNARLAALRSMFAYAALRHPEHAELIARVIAIPQKRHDKPLVAFLNDTEIKALLAAPDRTTWIGRRDHALLALAIQTGLRVSELTGLRCADVTLGTGSCVQCEGKGRKARQTPLTSSTQAVLRSWLRERAGHPNDPLFPTSTGARLTRDAIARRIAKHAGTAARRCPSLKAKQLTPHVLRHTSAMQLLHAGVDTTLIALWLGHEDVRSTQIYIHADMTIKERTLARSNPPSTTPGRYQPRDRLLAFLESL